jgi:hypothetical protein
MGLSFNQIDDAVLLTQNLLIKKGAFVDMQTDLTDHVAVREIWKKKQRKFDGGLYWTFNAQIDHNHSARAVGLFEDDSSSFGDTMIQGKVDARHVNAHYLYDLREPDFQRGGTKIVDLVKTRYVAMMVSFYEYLEDVLWGKPEDSSDAKTPFGIAYWVVKSGTAGFNGGNPAGFADGAGGIDSEKYPRWRNYTDKYAAVSKEDLIRKMRAAHRRTRFRSPVSHSVPNLSDMGNGIYTNDAVIGFLEEILESQNMNLGNDIASKDGRTMFKGTPITYVPKLNDDTTNPVYLLDWSYLQLGVMPGWENNLSAPYMVPNKHNVRRVDLDCTMNMVCTDRRRHAVISK